MTDLLCKKAGSFLTDKAITLLMNNSTEICNNPSGLAEKIIQQMRSSLFFPKEVRLALEQNRIVLDQALAGLASDPGFAKICEDLKVPEKRQMVETEIRNKMTQMVNNLMSKIPGCSSGSPMSTPLASPTPSFGGRRYKKKSRRVSRKNKRRNSRTRRTKH